MFVLLRTWLKHLYGMHERELGKWESLQQTLWFTANYISISQQAFLQQTACS